MDRVDSEWEKLLKKSQPSVFSDQIMFDILSRLPVNSIIRFKCVSKKWHELFGDSSFIAAHLKQSVEGSNYLVEERFCETGNALRVGYYLSDENFEELRELNFEIEPSFYYKIVASVDGLVCIQKIDPCNFKSSVLLWNPATRESRTLPECPVSIHRDTSIGFGIDPEKNDYKVVMMTSFEGSKRVDVYSLKTDRWKSFKVDNFFAFHFRGAHVNGRLHWLSARSQSDRFIVSFDLSDEEIIEISVPVNLNFIGCESPKSLEKFLILPVCNDQEETEIWLMKKYGDSKSWSKLYDIPSHPTYGYILSNQCFFLDNGNVIVHCSDNENMISYDPKNQVYKTLHIKGGADIIEYKESLVSVEGDGSFSNP